MAGILKATECRKRHAKVMQKSGDPFGVIKRVVSLFVLFATRMINSRELEQ